MKINENSRIPEVNVDMEGAKDVVMKILVGPKDGSDNIIMRYFKVLPGGYTPKHRHNYEHLVKIEQGKGIAIDENGIEHELSPAKSVFVEANREHQFKNPFSEIFEFICIIPNPEKSKG